MTVREARDEYLARNGFTIAGYTAETFQIDFLGRTWTLKNPRSRMRVVPLHDLHHVVTGFGTDLRGESEQSAWELRAGINSPFLWLFKLSAIAIGLVLSPMRVIRSFRRAKGDHSLYVDASIAYDDVLAMTVGELRSKLGVPEDGLADRDADLHRRAPPLVGRREMSDER